MTSDCVTGFSLKSRALARDPYGRHEPKVNLKIPNGDMDLSPSTSSGSRFQKEVSAFPR
jgi:hypothetical protein